MRTRNTYTAEQIERGLFEVAACAGNTAEAEKRLRARGLLVPAKTLRDWRSSTHADRYEQVKSQYRTQLEPYIVEQLQASIVRSGEVLMSALDRTQEQLDAGEVKDAAGVARNLATVRGIDSDKYMLYTGRPTQVTEHRDTTEILRALKAVAPGLIIDGDGAAR